MKVSVRVLLAVLAVAALTALVSAADVHRRLRRLRKVAAKSDSEYDIYGGGVKDKQHEAIASAAWNALTAEKKDLFTEGLLHNGVRWNDMPSGVDNDYLALGPFMTDFKGTWGTDKDTMVWNSHYGCLQQLHSMAPVFTPRDVPTVGQVDNVLFTNAEVKSLIRSQLKYLWDGAVANKESATSRSFWAGKMLHVLADSYAGGHAVRGWVSIWQGSAHVDAPKDMANFDTTSVESLSTAGYCGKLIYFQGYGAQHGNEAHAKGDHDPESLKAKGWGTDLDNRKRFVKCAVSANYLILDALAGCIGGGDCNFDSALGAPFDAWYSLSLPDKMAGGSLDSMRNPDISQTDYTPVGITYTNLMGTPIATSIWTPMYELNQQTAVNEHKWSDLPAATPLCTTNMNAKKAGPLFLKKPFTNFHNTKRDGTDAQAH